MMGEERASVDDGFLHFGLRRQCLDHPFPNISLVWVSNSRILVIIWIKLLHAMATSPDCGGQSRRVVVRNQN